LQLFSDAVDLATDPEQLEDNDQAIRHFHLRISMLDGA
jgi:hypothetical protein